MFYAESCPRNLDGIILTSIISPSAPGSSAYAHTRCVAVVVLMSSPAEFGTSGSHATTVPHSLALANPSTTTAIFADPPPTVSTFPYTNPTTLVVALADRFTVFLLARTTASPSRNVPVPFLYEATGNPFTDHDFMVVV